MHYPESVKSDTNVRGADQRLTNARSLGGLGCGLDSGKHRAMAQWCEGAGRLLGQAARFYLGARGNKRDDAKQKMKLVASKSQYDRVREIKLREMACVCEKMAEDGQFLPIGERCDFCVHSIIGGCRLRLMAAQAAE